VIPVLGKVWAWEYKVSTVHNLYYVVIRVLSFVLNRYTIFLTSSLVFYCRCSKIFCYCKTDCTNNMVDEDTPNLYYLNCIVCTVVFRFDPRFVIVRNILSIPSIGTSFRHLPLPLVYIRNNLTSCSPISSLLLYVETRALCNLRLMILGNWYRNLCRTWQ
jgi:hypothetical protein